MHASGKKRAEIAKETGYKNAQTITDLVRQYKSVRLAEYAKKHYKGNHRNLTFEQETELLAPFIEEAKAGQMVRISKIKAAYEKKSAENLTKTMV